MPNAGLPGLGPGYGKSLHNKAHLLPEGHDFPIGLPADQIWTLSVPVTVSIHGGDEASGAVVPLVSRVPLAGKLPTSSHALKFRPDSIAVVALTGAGCSSHTVPTSGTGIHFWSLTQFDSVDFSHSMCIW